MKIRAIGLLSLAFIFENAIAQTAPSDPPTHLPGASREAATAAKDRGIAAHDSGDFDEAFKWLRIASAQGDADAQVSLGLMFAQGDGVAIDYAQALEWFRIAAAQDYALAQHNLGVMYLEGNGVPKNTAEALRWFRLAADQGDMDAQYNLGQMYRQGLGVPQDSDEARKWYLLAAGRGDAGSQYNLGVLSYNDGRRRPRAFADAMKWYRLAAVQGHAAAQLNLGVMYANGDGVAQDPVKAYFCFSTSAAKGEAKATENLAKLVENMTKAQIAAGQALSRKGSDPRSDNCQ